MGGLGSGRRTDVGRNAMVLAARKRGEKLAEIARRFGVTRERIRQICERSGLPGIRSETFANESEVAPFLEDIDKDYCLLCGEERDRTHVKLCGACADFIDVIRDIKSRLRSMPANGHGNGHGTMTRWHYRNTALCLIRKHNIKPEDLRLI